MKNKFDPNNVVEKTKTILNAAGRPAFGQELEEFDVRIRPNDNVELALFKPDPLLPGGYIAHTLTIKAMRKDLFMHGEDFVDLEHKYICEGCKKELDLQFWQFCPYCEKPFTIDA